MPESEMTGNILFFTSRQKSAAKTADANEKSRAGTLIIERIGAGDREAFDDLYQMFAPLVHGILLARLPRGEVDDIVQEVFLLAYKNLHNLRDPSAVGAWLAMIARNCATEFYRRAKPTEELPEDLSGKSDSHAEAQEVWAAIRALPETYRETLVLRLVEGMTGAEIAAQIGLTPESVRVNLHRGMKLLRRNLGIREQ